MLVRYKANLTSAGNKGKFNVTRQDVPKHLGTNGEIIFFG